MGRSRRSAVQRYHDRVAGRYDHSYADPFWRWHDELTWDYLKPFLPRDMSARIADLGCGTGRWGARLVKSGYHVTSVDISPQMIDQARRKIEGQEGDLRKAEFLRADLGELSALPGKTFSLALALGDPIGCTSSPAAAMKEVRRVLTDQGVLVATFDNRLAALDYFLSGGDPKALSRFLRDGKTEWLTRDVRERFPVFTFAPHDIERLVESTGFELLDLVGKTVLPMRNHRDLLSEPESRRRFARLEKALCRDRYALGRASHLQIACRVTTRRRGSRLVS